jgi:hypothetical protein
MQPVGNQRCLQTRAEINGTAATLLRRFIKDIGISTRRFAEETGIAESTLRYFLSNGDATNVKSPSRRHGRGPYIDTLKRLLDLPLPMMSAKLSRTQSITRIGWWLEYSEAPRATRPRTTRKVPVKDGTTSLPTFLPSSILSLA